MYFAMDAFAGLCPGVFLGSDSAGKDFPKSPCYVNGPRPRLPASRGTGRGPCQLCVLLWRWSSRCSGGAFSEGNSDTWQSTANKMDTKHQGRAYSQVPRCLVLLPWMPLSSSSCPILPGYQHLLADHSFSRCPCVASWECQFGDDLASWLRYHLGCLHLIVECRGLSPGSASKLHLPTTAHPRGSR